LRKPRREEFAHALDDESLVLGISATGWEEEDGIKIRLSPVPPKTDIDLVVGKKRRPL
jgi:hypothetical protein